MKPLFHILISLLILVLSGCPAKSSPEEPLTLGLIAPLTGPLAYSGEAIQRGMLLAMDEINAGGGVLGLPLGLRVRDVQKYPDQGVRALR